ncbi:MAG: hypothetical protein JWM89_23 [Acidimicrobiales bacterium]|nr:hypothetical protein [Acidimicrobiales bacterium]
MAEVLLRARLAAVGVDATVSSAGFLFDGRAAEPGALAAMERVGLDLGAHLARTIQPAILGAADLVITMEHRHVREVALADGGDLARTFTYPDLVERAEHAGPRGDEPFSEWIAALAEGRPSSEVLRADPLLEVIDPMGQSNKAFRVCAEELQELGDRFVELAWPFAIAEAARRADPRDPHDPHVPLETRSS